MAKEMTEDMMDMIRHRGEYASPRDAEFMGFPYSSERVRSGLEGAAYASAALPIPSMGKYLLAVKALKALKNTKGASKARCCREIRR